MPDENGVCHCGSTGADGCSPRPPAPPQSGPDRRTALYRELWAGGAGPGERVDGDPPPRLARRAPSGARLLTARVDHPLLARTARNDPVLAHLLAPISPDQPPDFPADT